MSVVYLGRFVVGDADSDLTITVRTASGAYVFTGAGSIELVVQPVGKPPFTIAGSIVSPAATSGQLFFEAVSQNFGAYAPAIGDVKGYDCRVRWRNSGDSDYSYAPSLYRIDLENIDTVLDAAPSLVPNFDLHELMRLTPFWVTNGEAEWESWYDTTTSAGGSFKLRGSHFQYDTGTGANKVYWRKREPERTMYPNTDTYTIDGNEQEQVFRIPHTISAFLSFTTRSNTTATQFIGIGLGAPANSYTSGDLPAGSTEFFGDGGGQNPCFQLRLKMQDLSWQLVCYRGDGSTLTVVALTGVHAAVSAKGQNIKMEWDPVALTLKAYVNGVLGATISNPALLPEMDTFSNIQAHIAGNYFVSSGSHASGRVIAQIGPIVVTRNLNDGTLAAAMANVS